LPDPLMPRYFALATDWPPARVEEVTRALTAGELKPVEAKRLLARSIVDLYHGDGAGRPPRPSSTGSSRPMRHRSDLPEFRPRPVQLRTRADPPRRRPARRRARDLEPRRQAPDQRGRGPPRTAPLSTTPTSPSPPTSSTERAAGGAPEVGAHPSSLLSTPGARPSASRPPGAHRTGPQLRRGAGTLMLMGPHTGLRGRSTPTLANAGVRHPRVECSAGPGQRASVPAVEAQTPVSRPACLDTAP